MLNATCCTKKTSPNIKMVYKDHFRDFFFFLYMPLLITGTSHVPQEGSNTYRGIIGVSTVWDPITCYETTKIQSEDICTLAV